MNENEEMLRFLGLRSVDDLFSDIPEKFRTGKPDIPEGMSEMEVVSYLKNVLDLNVSSAEYTSYVGAGAYDTFVPALVQHVIGRSELYTSYTPYQAELSQGLLQLIFEYQSMMSELTAMDVVNASLYDGASATGEAAMMCTRIREGSNFLIPRAMAPWKKSVIANYLVGTGVTLREYGYSATTGQANTDELRTMAREGACGAYVEMPNFLGVYQEDIMDIKNSIGNVPLVAGVNPLSLATVVPPGEYGADIVVGEGQPLGLGLNFGGPYLGIFACRKEHVRKMPGRVVGVTVDGEGRRSFCLTLQAREQHIRRSKATSNVCTNQTLLSVAASVYIAAMGTRGLKSLADTIEYNRSLAMDAFVKAGFIVPFRGYGFNEFVLKTNSKPEHIAKEMLRHHVIAGLPLGGILPELGNASLWAVNERTDGEEIRKLVKAVASVN